MRNGLVGVLVLAGVLVSCKDSKMQNAFATDDEQEDDSVEAYVGDTLHLFAEEEEPPATVDELFDDFFYSFVDDARFQRQRIAFPLPCKEDEEETRLTGEEWQQFDRFDAQEFYSFIYEREQDVELQKDTAMQSVDVEWISLRDNRVEQFDFNRVGGKWTLTEVRKVPREKLPNGDFLTFYAQFVNDSTFQRESLAEPVRLILTSEDGEEENQEEELAADDWFNMKGDLPLPTDALICIDYGQACISQNRKTLMMQGLSNGLQMKFRFNKDGDDWKLIEIEY